MLCVYLRGAMPACGPAQSVRPAARTEEPATPGPRRLSEEKGGD